MKFFKLDSNNHKYVTKNEKDAKVVRNGNDVHVYMTAIRSHFTPDNIEGVKVGDNVYFHLTNLEQDWDVPHGFSVKGANNSELLVLPGETATLKWTPDRAGVFLCIAPISVLHFIKKCRAMCACRLRALTLHLSFLQAKNRLIVDRKGVSSTPFFLLEFTESVF